MRRELGPPNKARCLAMQHPLLHWKRQTRVLSVIWSELGVQKQPGQPGSPQIPCLQAQSRTQQTLSSSSVPKPCRVEHTTAPWNFTEPAQTAFLLSREDPCQMRSRSSGHWVSRSNSHLCSLPAGTPRNSSHSVGLRFFICKVKTWVRPSQE